jgi:hypothetical protein
MNASVITQIKASHALETLAVTGKLKYFRHLTRTSGSLETDLMLGLTDTHRRPGRQWTRWTDEIQRTLTVNWHNIINATQDRRQWRDLYKAVEDRKQHNMDN